MTDVAGGVTADTASTRAVVAKHERKRFMGRRQGIVPDRDHGFVDRGDACADSCVHSSPVSSGLSERATTPRIKWGLDWHNSCGALLMT